MNSEATTQGATMTTEQRIAFYENMLAANLDDATNAGRLLRIDARKALYRLNRQAKSEAANQ